MIKLVDGRITILIDRNETTVYLDDGKSRQRIVEIKLTPDQLSSALSRCDKTRCEITINEYSFCKLNKTKLTQRIIFEIPKDIEWKDKEKVAYDYALKNCPSNWIVDNYFRSQGSFFYDHKKEKQYAKAIIRKWID